MCYLAAKPSEHGRQQHAVHTPHVTRRPGLDGRMGALPPGLPREGAARGGGSPPGARRPALPRRGRPLRRRIHRPALLVAGPLVPLRRTPGHTARPAGPEPRLRALRILLPRRAGDPRNRPPRDEISTRRLGFYRRLGFHDSPAAPMSTPRTAALRAAPPRADGISAPLEQEEARRLADFVRRVVLHYTEHRQPTLPRIP